MYLKNNLICLYITTFSMELLFVCIIFGAVGRERSGNLRLGKAALYRLSYYRLKNPLPGFGLFPRRRVSLKSDSVYPGNPHQSLTER